ncbi:hypothetical protein SAMN05660662_3288 [Blastococcus aurantiacus]|uniref:Uncharacterized protein n=1 Tax=Blastococcus aurantiacus TaxID=1550231 RepID=A0A1G7NPX3_9ACTN|nr:hypothetical protein [Blastococcus aurantiacus]SDF76032.1 hypothetical protein SAMN05660662_3288 [Blastococcus aurantiacus]
MRIRPALLAASAVVLLAVLLGGWLLMRPVDPAGGTVPAPITVPGRPSGTVSPTPPPTGTPPDPVPVPGDVVPPPPVPDDDGPDDDGPDDDGPDDDGPDDDGPDDDDGG